MWKKMKLGPKLITSFVITVLIASISGIVGIFMLLSTDTQYSLTLVENGFSQGDIGSFNTYLNKSGCLVRDIILLTDDAEMKAAQSELQDVSIQADNALLTTKEVCQTPEELELIATIETALNDYRGYRDQIISFGLANKSDEARSMFHDKADPLLDQAMEAGEKLAALNKDIGTKVSNDLTANTQVTLGIIIAVLVAASAIAVLFAMFVARSISKPIVVVQKAAHQLEDGDLNINVSSDLEDEVGLMTRSFSQASSQLRAYINDLDQCLSMVAGGNFRVQLHEDYKGDFKALETSIISIVTSLSSAMEQIREASDQVSAGADQVSSGAQALAQGATEQASSVEELAASCAEISTQVQETAKNSLEAKSLAADAGSQVMVCDAKMQEMNSAMDTIGKSSAEIGKIIRVIDNIAFQTNILALNAAVEAARAGSAGKGFAVVADEVRSLAIKSAEAAKDTTALIENSINSVEGGTLLAKDAALALQEVVTMASGVSDIIGKISEATDLQSTSISQVTIGIDQISAVVQNNSATSEESAAASEELSGQAQTLKSLVGQFKLR